MAGARAIGASTKQLGSIELAAAALWDPSWLVTEEQPRQKPCAGMLGAFDEKALYPGADVGVLAAGQFFCQMLGSYCFWTAATSLCCGWPAHLSVLEELMISHSEAELTRTIPKKADRDNPVCNRDFLPCCSSVYMQVGCRALFTSVADSCVCSQCPDFALLCLEVGSKVFEGLWQIPFIHNSSFLSSTSVGFRNAVW